MSSKQEREFRIKHILRSVFEYASENVAEVLGPPTDLPTLRITETNAGGTFLSTSSTRQTQPFNASVRHAIRTAPQLPALIKEAASLGILNFHYDSNWTKTPIDQLPADVAADDLMNLYIQYLDHSGADKYLESAFDDYWQYHGDEVTDRKARAVRLLGIDNLNVNGRTYYLSDSAILRPLAPRERERWLHLTGGHWRISAIQSVIEILYERDLDEPMTEEIDIQQALRMGLAIATGRSLVISCVEDHIQRADGGGSVFVPVSSTRQNTLEAQEDLITRWLHFAESSIREKASTGARGRRITLAMRRYAQALDRSDAVDAFVDMWIALEALFGTKAGEVAFSLALRIALYLKSEWDDPKQLFGCIQKEWYKERSDLLHGAKSGPPSNDACAGTERVLRLSLQRICTEPASFPDSPSDIEKSLITR